MMYRRSDGTGKVHDIPLGNRVSVCSKFWLANGEICSEPDDEIDMCRVCFPEYRSTPPLNKKTLRAWIDETNEGAIGSAEAALLYSLKEYFDV